MNFSFPSLYKEIESRYIDDDEVSEVLHILTENVYREELLKLFNKEKYDESMDEMVETLYNQIKTNENISRLLEIIKEKYEDEMMAFTLLFSYDYFYLFLPILKNIMEDLPVDIQPLANVFFINK
jgi:hypothetical protein